MKWLIMLSFETDTVDTHKCCITILFGFNSFISLLFILLDKCDKVVELRITIYICTYIIYVIKVHVHLMLLLLKYRHRFYENYGLFSHFDWMIIFSILLIKILFNLKYTYIVISWYMYMDEF